MPYKSEQIKIQGTKHDRRRKLTERDKQEIRENKENLSQRGLAKKYGVSRRMIVFVLFPERQKKNYEDRVARGGSKQYYDREKHTQTIREHRQYKQELFKNGEIKLKEDKK